jgi:hypothetical protein
MVSQENWKEKQKYILKDVRCCYNCRFSSIGLFDHDRVCKQDIENWHKVQDNGFCSRYKGG